MRASLLKSVACVVAALMAASGASAEALRCGSKLISRGDHASEVRRYCGEPDEVYSRVSHRGVVGVGSIFLPGFVEEVLIEEWTYNLGPRKLMRQLRLENGVVQDVEHLGYGYLER